MNLSVVVPVYNSAECTAMLVARLEPVLRAEADAFEVVLVNDGSRDESWAAIQDAARGRPWVRGINLMRNYGQHCALLCGIRAARHEVIVTMDDDLQNPPEEIPKLLRRLEEGCDVVYGPAEKEQHGLYRDATSVLSKFFLRHAMGVETARHESSFRAFRTELRRAFDSYNGTFISIDVLLSWGTANFGHVPVRHEARAAGASNYNFRKLFTHLMDLVTGYSTVPLQLASLLGFVFCLFGGVLLLYVLWRYIETGGPVQGFTFLACTIVIFSGVQLFTLGIIGEYLARMHFRLMNRPPYAVRETTSGSGEGPE